MLGETDRGYILRLEVAGDMYVAESLTVDILAKTTIKPIEEGGLGVILNGIPYETRFIPFEMRLGFFFENDDRKIKEADDLVIDLFEQKLYEHFDMDQFD